jgi:two-component system, sensor histidine kinase and response regulator
MARTLLIADADVILLDLCQHSFTAQGYQVETASTGLDCLAKLRQCQPDLLILDWALPWGGGDGVIAQMRQDVLLPRVPVILTLPATAPERPEELVESPVLSCVRKPFRTRHLLQEVQSIESLAPAREPG